MQFRNSSRAAPVNAQPSTRWRILSRLIGFLWELGPREVEQLLLLTILSGLLPVVRVGLLRRLIDSATQVVHHTASYRTALVWLALLLALSLCQSLFDIVNPWLNEETREKLTKRAQERLLAKSGRMPLARFEQPEFYDQMERAQRGIDTQLLRTLEVLFPMPAYIVTGVSLWLYMASAHPLFPLMLLAGLLPSHFLGRFYGRKRYELTQKHTPPDRLLRYYDSLMVNRNAATEVRLFGLQSYLFSARQSLCSRLRRERLHLAREQAVGFTLPTVGEQLSYGLVVIGVVALIAQRRLTVGYYAAYLDAAERFRDAFLFFVTALTRLDESQRYLADLFAYLELPEETAPKAIAPPTATTVSPPVPRIRFEAVSFTYPGAARPTLVHIDFTLRPGERIALVGQNGAGKSTFAKLLLGLYAPTEGRITVDGVDMRDLDPAVWRGRVSAVFQDYVRYQATVRENIGFGDLARMQEEQAIATATARSGADAVIAALPRGYDTPLGKGLWEDGRDLSIGQWQKLAIARAYVREADLLVLDEPTVALDARSEVEVYEQFKAMSEGRSVLFITHRLGSARLADRILVLEHGGIIEEGDHNALMAQNGRYAEMARLQASWYL